MLGQRIVYPLPGSWVGDQTYGPYVPPYDPIQPPYVPTPQVVPSPLALIPPLVDWGSIIMSPPTVTLFRRRWDPDRITTSIDVPGCRSCDVTVTISDFVISATGKRPDTLETFTHTCPIGDLYDPDTATATLEAGVLTVVVERFKEPVKRVRSVPITSK